jgi:hypothetical protein
MLPVASRSETSLINSYEPSEPMSFRLIITIIRLTSKLLLSTKTKPTKALQKILPKQILEAIVQYYVSIQ